MVRIYLSARLISEDQYFEEDFLFVGTKDLFGFEHIEEVTFYEETNQGTAFEDPSRSRYLQAVTFHH